MVCTHCPVLPHESAIVYVRVIVLGHVPLSDTVAVKEDSTSPQLSEAVITEGCGAFAQTVTSVGNALVNTGLVVS